MRQEPTPQFEQDMTEQLAQERQQRLERSILEAHKASALAYDAIERAAKDLGLDLTRKGADDERA